MILFKTLLVYLILSQVKGFGIIQKYREYIDCEYLQLL
jgi:hypothetical protein